jgi:hypothetical protein
VPEPPSFDLILAAETKRMPLASKIVKITDVTMDDDGYDTQGSPVDMYQAALFSFCFLAFLGLGGA